MWMEYIVKITKDIMHMVIDHSIGEKEKVGAALKNEIEKKTGAMWDGRGL